MEVLNKFYSSVTSTVSQLSGVLPGNPVTRDFEATEFIATAGPGLLWKVYKGYKKSTRQEAAIFLFEKKQLDRWSKADRDIMLDIVKRGIMQLTKLRHPQILIVQQSLEESRESLAFATEPVFASLANILGNTENIPHPIPSHLLDYKLYEIEISYGLMQIAEGLAFLHDDVKLLHRNICPESIIVNQQGAWKIFGFDFAIVNQNAVGGAPRWPFNKYCQAMPPVTQPSLDYLAPEYFLSATHSPASDMYSLGMLIYTLHSTGFQTLGDIGNEYSKYKELANETKNLHPSRLSCVPDDLKHFVTLMLNARPKLRPGPHDFLRINYFDNIGVKTLSYLDSLFHWDNLKKSQFYRGLPEILQTMPHRICLNRILPSLTKEFVNPPMVPFVLTNVLLIAEKSTQEEYTKHILPKLKRVMIMQEPIQIQLIFMQKNEVLLKLTPPDEVKSDILPMFYRALDFDNQQLQELCLSVLPTFASFIDYQAMKNALLPRIKKLCMNSAHVSVQVNCLLCLGRLLEYLDKWLVLDDIVPFLPLIPSKDPAVLMGIIGLYKLTLSHEKLGITKEVMAQDVLPFLIPLCVERKLTMNQFSSLMALIRQMFHRIEMEQRVRLEQLGAAQKDTLAKEGELAMSADFLLATPGSITDIDKIFSRLGYDPKAYKRPLPREVELTVPSNDEAGTLRMAKLLEAEMTLSQPPVLQPAAVFRPVPQPCPVNLTNSVRVKPNAIPLSRSIFDYNAENNEPSPGDWPPGTVMRYNSFSSNENFYSLSPPPISCTIIPNDGCHRSSENISQAGNFPVPTTSYSCPTSIVPSPTANFNSRWKNNQNQANFRQDWSAFESLLTDDNVSNSNESAKTQSSSEMVDLLD